MKKHQLKNWPKKTGVYLMMNSKKQIIYIGKAKNLFSRIHSYFSSSSNSLKNQFLVNQVFDLDYILTQTETEAYLLEASLVKKYKPKYNVRLKDDKSYPYICVSTKDAFPRLYLERKVKRNGNTYFGPYTGGVVKNMIRFLNETYQIRDCRNAFMKSRKSPCLTYQMGCCTAPCVDKAAAKQYSNQVQQVLSFLKGREAGALKKLKKQMNQHAQRECFEQALDIKNKIASISTVWEKQSVLDDQHKTDSDVLACFTDGVFLLFEMLYIRSGRLIGRHSYFEKNWLGNSKEIELNFISFLIQYYAQNLIPDQIIVPSSWSLSSVKGLSSALNLIERKKASIHPPKKRREHQWARMAQENAEDKFKMQSQRSQTFKSALSGIQKIFKLPKFPRRMECYDISHHQSQAVYGSQVVFEDGLPKKEDYRLYKLKDVNNDCQSMKVCLTRRFSHTEWPLPDFILIDGGKGQLKAVEQIFKENNMEFIPIAAIAKPQKSGKTSFQSSVVKSAFEKFYIPLRKNPIRISEKTPAFRLLVQLRDEAHRFAFSRHQKKQRSSAFLSSITDIPGMGEKRKIKLLKEFKSRKGIQKAGVQKIQKVLRVPLQTAQNIVDSLK